MGTTRVDNIARRQSKTSKSMFKNVKIYFFSLKVAAIDGGECGAHESTGFCRAATSWCGAVAAGARGRHDKKNNNKVKNKVKKNTKSLVETQPRNEQHRRSQHRTRAHTGHTAHVGLGARDDRAATGAVGDRN